MKKIIIIALSLFILTSCGVNEEINKTVEQKVEKSEINDVILDDELPGIINNKISILDLEKNISKLKDIGFNDENLRSLNEQVVWMFNNSIENKAIKDNNIEVCNKLDENYVEYCKKQVIIKSGNIDSCDDLSQDYLKRECKNTILKELSLDQLDENICDKLIFEEIKNTWESDIVEITISEKEFEINNCKNRVFNKKATKNIDSTFCKEISEENEILMCEELVKMEEENKAMEEEMEKQMKELEWEMEQ